MIIRDMTGADKKIFLKMSENFYHSDAVLHDFSARITEQNLEGALSGSPYVRCLMLEETAGTPSGYAVIAHSWSSEAGGPMIILEELYLEPAARGQGLAAKFFDWFFEEYKGWAAGYRLEVAPKNADVLGLYEKYGYEKLAYIQMLRPAKRS